MKYVLFAVLAFSLVGCTFTMSVTRSKAAAAPVAVTVPTAVTQ